MTERKINNRVKRLMELDAQIHALEQERKAIIEEIQAEMTEPEVRTNTYIVRWTPYKTTRFDSTALKKDFPDMYREYARETESKRFSYKTA